MTDDHDAIAPAAEVRWRLAEAAAVAAAGAVLGGVVGSRIGAGRAMATVAGLNGAISGWRGVYRWRSRAGSVAFVLDSTWALVTTAGALGSHLIAVGRRRPGYDGSLSRRQNRHVYRRGFQTRPGFLITVGNVVSGAGDTSTERRRRLVAVHEDVHVGQARWLGPLYPALYAGWMVLGAAAGAAVWAVSHRDQPLGRVIETVSYYMNPFEWWAYSRDDAWPPGKAVVGLAWRRPMAAARVGRIR